MFVVAGDTVGFEFHTWDSAGEVADASSTPTGAVIRNGAVDGAVTVTVTDPAGTGVYKAAFTVPSAYALKDIIQVRMNWPVGAYDGIQEVYRAQVVTLADIPTAVDARLVTIRVSTRQVGTIEIVRGDSYLNAIGTHITITKASGATWPTDLTGGTITFTARVNENNVDVTGSSPASVTSTGTIVTATGDGQSVRFDLTKAQTEVLSTGTAAYDYDVQWSVSTTQRATLETGSMTVRKDQTTS